MKITQENGGIFHTFDIDKTARCEFFPSLDAEKARVIECPKVVRENGIQYKVIALDLNGVGDDYLKEIKVPKGTKLYGLYSWHGKITWY